VVSFVNGFIVVHLVVARRARTRRINEGRYFPIRRHTVEEIESRRAGTESSSGRSFFLLGLLRRALSVLSESSSRL